MKDEILRTRETVSVGTSERNRFVVSGEALPSRFELFQLVRDDYVLNFTERMSGRVALPGGIETLDQLRATGGARRAGAYWQVKLSDASRGKLVLGDTTLLFQFVTPPIPAPKPQLPAAVRGGFWKSIDWPFTTFVVAFFLGCFASFLYLDQLDPEVDASASVISEDLVQMLYVEPAASRAGGAHSPDEAGRRHGARDRAGPDVGTRPRSPSGEALRPRTTASRVRRSPRASRTRRAREHARCSSARWATTERSPTCSAAEP